METKTVMLRGIVMMNFELEITPDQFAEVCKENDLSLDNVENFTSDNWLAIRGSLGEIVSDSENDLDCATIYDHNSISVDECCVQKDDIITCLYEQGDAVHSVEISQSAKSITSLDICQGIFFL